MKTKVYEETFKMKKGMFERLYFFPDFQKCLEDLLCMRRLPKAILKRSHAKHASITHACQTYTYCSCSLLPVHVNTVCRLSRALVTYPSSRTSFTPSCARTSISRFITAHTYCSRKPNTRVAPCHILLSALEELNLGDV